MTHQFLCPANAKIYYHNGAFELEQGGILPELQIAYHSWGNLNATADNAVFVFHALTANSDAATWWPGMIGRDYLLNPEQYFIVCANVLGSFYGTTSPRFIHPDSGMPYGLDFPKISVRDIVKAAELLLEHLNINTLALCIGGSFGGHQALEAAISWNIPIKHLALLACSAKETAWSIAIHETQRMALETDPSFFRNEENAGVAGLKTARAVGLISYRTIEAYIKTQTDKEDEKMDDFRASSYVRYQGDKLAARFHAHCYWYLTKCLDTHHIGRGRWTIESVLNGIKIPTTIIAIQGDMLIPPSEQLFMHQHIPDSTYHEVDSAYGHDGFLIEVGQITEILRSRWLGIIA